MGTFVADFDYVIHASARVTHKLVVIEETVSVENHKASIRVYIERKNSGRDHDANYQALELKFNGVKVADREVPCPLLKENSSDVVFNAAYWAEYDSDGKKDLTVKATYKSEEVFSGIYGTVATAEIKITLTPIDMSSPTISNVKTSGNRYGTGVSTSFKASHSAYPIRSIYFTFYNLTSDQARYRAGKITEADSSQYSYSPENEYYLVLHKYKNLSSQNNIEFNLDDYENNKYPLDSGKSYRYEILIEAVNGKTAKISKTLVIPQKVTGITCNSEINLLPGETTELEYKISPANAEEKGVIFHSTDPNIASIDSNGKITAINEGSCQLTVTTIDGGSLDAVKGFTAVCNVDVLDKNTFPKLETLQFLSTKDVSKIVFATDFLREKLIAKGVSVPQAIQIINKGRSHPVKDIKKMLDDINSNCISLKNSASKVYDLTDISIQTKIAKENTGSNWFVSINEWVRFLNKLNELIEKEV